MPFVNTINDDEVINEQVPTDTANGGDFFSSLLKAGENIVNNTIGQVGNKVNQEVNKTINPTVATAPTAPITDPTKKTFTPTAPVATGGIGEFVKKPVVLATVGAGLTYILSKSILPTLIVGGAAYFLANKSITNKG